MVPAALGVLDVTLVKTEDCCLGGIRWYTRGYMMGSTLLLLSNLKATWIGDGWLEGSLFFLSRVFVR